MSAKEDSSFDARTLVFPSDALTVRMLRDAHPALFDLEFETAGVQPVFFNTPSSPGHVESTVGEMLYIERVVARRAYAKQRGARPSSDCSDIRALKAELARWYQRYGLAEGPAQATELIRDIERQAGVLARGCGRSP